MPLSSSIKEVILGWCTPGVVWMQMWVLDTNFNFKCLFFCILRVPSNAKWVHLGSYNPMRTHD